MSESNNIVFNTRKTLGLTQTELAEKLDMSLGYIYKLENGKKPIGPKVIKKLENLKKNENSTKGNNEKSEMLVKEETTSYNCTSIIDDLRKQLKEAHEREKIHLEIIKNLSQNGG